MVQIVYDNRVLTIDGQDAETVSSLVKELSDSLAKEKSDSAELLGTLETTNADLTTKVSTLQGKVDGLEASKTEVKTDADVINAEVASRLDTWSLVKPHLAPTVEVDFNLDSNGIKKLWLTQELPQLAEKIANADSSYVDALWDTQKPEEVAIDSVKEAVEATTNTDSTVEVDGLEAARKAYIDSRINKG